MAINNDDNKKLNQTASQATAAAGHDVDARYVTTTLNPDGTGSQNYSPIDFNISLEYSFTERYNSTGGYYSREAHNKTELTSSLEYETRTYNIGGASITGETHGQFFWGDTSSFTTVGDSGRDTGRNHQQTVRKNKMIAVAGSTIKREGESASDNHTFKSASGDKSEDYGKNLYLTVGKDRITTVNDNEILQVASGDCATHVQSGNYDTKVKEKYKVFSGDDLLIQSATKITLRVGNSSIVIEPDHIYIIANNSQDRIDLNPGGAGPGTGDPSETA
jgi:hypothetical protein